MKLVIIHYHLNRGGVTSVIRNQIQALAGESPINEVMVLHGSGTEGWPGRLEEHELFAKLHRLQFHELPGLGYAEGEHYDTQLFELIRSVLDEQGFHPADTLIQAHNHNLGKNNSLMATLPRLAKESGYPTVLQIHDFAEDMRPDNYAEIQRFCRHNQLAATDLVFPDDPRIHFAFLNQRDLNLVRDHYVAHQRCHLLPNPVSVQPLNHHPISGQADSDSGPVAKDNEGIKHVRQTLGCEPDEKLVIYPVRAIRRKNVAEAMLLAASGQNLRVAVTLPAVSEDEVVQYRNLTQAAREWGLPIVFEAGQMGLEFDTLISAADFIFTSSVAEGFGMVFLESWCWGKHLIGRDLSPITHDFVESGLNLDGLYQELKIPLEWLDLRSESERQRKLLQEVLEQYELEIESSVDFAQENQQGWIDFAKLTHGTQLNVISRVWHYEAAQKMLLTLNPQFNLPEYDYSLVNHNAGTVVREFTGSMFRQRFLAMAEHLFKKNGADGEAENHQSTLPPRPPQEWLVKSFLDPQSFLPLRVERE